MEAKEKAQQPEGRTPFDGLSPRDFFDEWPDGQLSPPAEFDAYPFADDEQRQGWLQAIELLQDLVLDYRHYVAVKKRQAVVRDTGLSTNTLSNFNGGARFPKLSTYLALRAALPERTRELREAAQARERRKALADAKWVEKETQERMSLEVQRRVEAQLRRGRPSR